MTAASWRQSLRDFRGQQLRPFLDLRPHLRMASSPQFTAINMANPNTEAPVEQDIERSTLSENSGAILQSSEQFNDIYEDLFGDSDQFFGEGTLQQSFSLKPEVLENIATVFPAPVHYGNGGGDYRPSTGGTYTPGLWTPVSTARPAFPPFNFLNLPSEMRNAIYDLLGYSTPKNGSCKTIEEKGGTVEAGRHVGNGVHLSVSDGPDINMLCVSKQFNSEYTARVRMQATWNFTDTYRPIPLSVRLDTNPQIKIATQIKTAHFRLLSSCNYCQKSVPHGRAPGLHGTVLSGPLAAIAQAQGVGLPGLPAPTTNEPVLKECEIQREIGEQLTYIHSSLGRNFQSVKHYTIQLTLYDMPEKCAWPVTAGNKHMMSALNTMVSGEGIGAGPPELSGVEVVLAKKKTSEGSLAGGFDDLKDCVTHGTWTKKDGWQAAALKKNQEEVKAKQAVTTQVTEATV